MEKWTWLQVPSPWEARERGPRDFSQDFTDGSYGAEHFRTFDTASQASSDLRTFLLGEGDGQWPNFAACAALLTSDVTGGEFMLWSDMEPPRAWLVFRVPDGAHPAAVGAAMHKQWKAQARDEFMKSSFVYRRGELQGYRPGVWTPARRRPSPPTAPGRRSASPPTSGGCATALVLIICAIVFLLS